MTPDTPAEDRLRAALGAEAAAAAGARPTDENLSAIRGRVRTARRRRHAALAGVAAAVVVVGLVAVPHLDGDRAPVRTGDDGRPTTTPTTVVPPGPTVTLTPTPTVPSPEPGTPGPTAPVTTVPTTPSTVAPGPTLPMLWPFADADAVAAWQRADRAGGSQPWHHDPGQTAVLFTTQYLGFTENGTVTSQDVRGDQAWIGVGSKDDQTGRTYTAAVIHLRLVGGSDGGWEVVGTRDTDLTLETPAYGSTVSSPITVGGHVTGVDENLRVAVHAIGATGPIGETCCQPAGDVNTPWRMSVAYRGGAGQTLTVVVSTGGHRLAVERFAVTAVRAR